MNNIFTTVLNLSITAGLIALAVILFRFAFKKSYRWVNCLLWGLIGLRLLLPFSAIGGFDRLPVSESLSEQIPVIQTPVTQTPEIEAPVTSPSVSGDDLPSVDQITPPVESDPQHGANLTQTDSAVSEIVWKVAGYVWLAGVFAMAAYSVIGYKILSRRVRPSLRYRENIFYCDDIDSAFVFGIFRPRIYVPSSLLAYPEHLEHVLAHEKAHLKRLDHIWKLIGFVLLSVHWFNPILWVSYILMCRDIERACDEKVVKNMTNKERKSYAETLVWYSTPRKRVVGSGSVAFGEDEMVKRIKAVVNYRKPATWLVVLSLIVAAVIGLVGCSLDPNAAHADDPEIEIGETDTATEGETSILEGETTEEPKPSTPLEDYGIEGEYVEIVNSFYLHTWIMLDRTTDPILEKEDGNPYDTPRYERTAEILITNKEELEKFRQVAFTQEEYTPNYEVDEREVGRLCYLLSHRINFEEYCLIVADGASLADYDNPGINFYDKIPSAIIRQGETAWIMYPTKTYPHYSAFSGQITWILVVKKSDMITENGDYTFPKTYDTRYNY